VTWKTVEADIKESLIVHMAYVVIGVIIVLTISNLPEYRKDEHARNICSILSMIGVKSSRLGLDIRRECHQLSHLKNCGRL
jgi:hypothetical protein